MKVPPIDDHVVNVVEVLSFGFDTDQDVLELLDPLDNCQLFRRVFHSCLLFGLVKDVTDYRIRR